MSTEVYKRAGVLRNALDSGVLNLKELRAFLVSVEALASPITGRRKRRSRMHDQLARLASKPK